MKPSKQKTNCPETSGQFFQKEGDRVQQMLETLLKYLIIERIMENTQNPQMQRLADHGLSIDHFGNMVHILRVI